MSCIVECLGCCTRTQADEDLSIPDHDDQSKVQYEENMMETIKKGNFDEVEEIATPRNFKKCKSSSLRVAMKVVFKLREKANTKGPDNARFKQLANSVEEFICCFLDPLRSQGEKQIQFGNSILDEILDDAIDLEQKKFFTHPVVFNEMRRKWRERQSKGRFSECLDVPSRKFAFDTLSYIVLLCLSYVLCLTPSTVEFTFLEWIILVFFLGRLLAVFNQFRWIISRRLKHRKDKNSDEGQADIIRRAFKIYFRYLWNRTDCFVLLIFFVIFIVRAHAALLSQQVKDNYFVVAAGYLYGINTLALSFRVFFHVFEQLEKVGIIQITLIKILYDIRIVLGHFALAIWAFSFAITKVYVAEKSFSQAERNETGNICEESGISCWWAMLVHLTFLIVGLNKFNPVGMSLDTPSEILALLKYVIFLVLGVILITNLMVSVMSNTFQKIQDNSINEWAYRRAMTIVVYFYFDPIPVPLNVFYTLYTVKAAKCKKGKTKEDLSVLASEIIKNLETDYFAKYQNSLPLTAEKKVDRLLYETKGNRQMATQIICQSLHQSQASDYGIPQRGPEAWSIDHGGLQIEGCLLTCKCDESLFKCVDELCFHGAKYYSRLTERFPYFEVIILETGKRDWPGIGLVHEEYKLNKMPGWRRASLGYHTDDGKIYWCTEAQKKDNKGKETKGHCMARRGDLIRFTAVFAEKSRDGKVPVFITLNGKKIATEDGHEERFRLSVSSLYPYVCLTEGCSVSAQICCKENDVESKAQRMEKIETQLEETNRKLDIIMQRYESVV